VAPQFSAHRAAEVPDDRIEGTVLPDDFDGTHAALARNPPQQVRGDADNGQIGPARTRQLMGWPAGMIKICRSLTACRRTLPSGVRYTISATARSPGMTIWISEWLRSRLEVVLTDP